MTTLDLKAIVSVGGSVVVDANDFTAFDLKDIAATGKQSGGKLSVKYANKFNTLDCKAIASINPGNVEFDFSE